MRLFNQFAVLCCLCALSACASKQLQSDISRLETENTVLKNKLKKTKASLASLEEEVTFLQSRQQVRPARVQMSTPQKKPQKVVYDKSDGFFEEDIDAQEDTLVFTNKDLETATWAEQPQGKAQKMAKHVPTTSAKQDYKKAYQAFKDKNYKQSRTLMLGFIDRYPAHEYTDNAHFWIGETYYVHGQYQQADVYYKNVIRDFSQGNKVPDAMYRSALCAMKRSNKSVAKQSLQILLQKYPKTTAAIKAKKALQTLK